MSAVRYKAFLSYSHRDSRAARKLHAFLESYVVPVRLVGRATPLGTVPQRLRPIFRDRDELPSAGDLGVVVNAALAAAEHLIVVCSPSAARSRWVNEEVLAFKRLGRDDRILCFVVAGEPNATAIPGREHEECFCPALRFRLGADGELGSEPAEPIAADARRRQDGVSLARLKLVAGLIGVGVDDLRQREMQRRYRRLTYLTAAAFAGMALTGLLAVTAYTARNDAERRRDQADDLIGFMLGDLRERLNEVGRLDILDSVADKALEYFAALPSQELDHRALARRAEAMSQLGQVSLTRGDFGAARESFDEALRTMERLSARDPSDRVALFGLGQANFWVGNTHWESGDLAAADAHFRAYHDISQKLYEMDPNNDDYILELGYAFNNLAVLSDRRGDRMAALDYNQRMIELCRAVHERDPANGAYTRALAEAMSWRGTMLANDGQLAASEARFLDYLELATDALADDPENTLWLDHLMFANRFAGDGALDLGRLDEAEERYEDGLSVGDELIAIEPANGWWQVEHALLGLRVADMRLRRGAVEDAIAELERVRAVADARAADDSASTDWPFISAEIDRSFARALHAGGEDARASNIDALATARLRSLVDANPTDVPGRRRLATALLEDNLPQEALKVLDHESVDTRIPEVQALRLRAQLHAAAATSVTPPEAARAALARLASSGYRHPDFVADLGMLGIDY